MNLCSFGFWFAFISVWLFMEITVMHCGQSEPLIVKIKQGTLKGKLMTSRNGKEFASFLGIPYAEPPIKKLRFMAPVPASGWDGERDATHDSAMCFQKTINEENKTVTTGQEDCLYLNIYTPYKVRSSSEQKYAVMVFIHGGSLTSGDSKSSTFGPEYLMDKDVILVTFNYRLGLLGFLSMENDVLPGNSGLKDQVLALKWVKENIVHFGGNPDDVTLFGQSAGAVSAGFHLLSPLSKGLFQRLITQSGSPLNFWSLSHPGKKRDEANYIVLVTKCTRSTNRQILECLQNLSPDKFFLSSVFNVANLILNSLPYNIGIVREPPNTKDAFLTKNPWNEIVKPSNVTWIIGVNSGEGIWAAEKAYPYRKDLFKLVDTFSDINFPLLFGYSYTETNEFCSNATSLIKQYYFGNRSMSKSFPEFSELCTDRGFLQPAIDSAKYYNGPKYFYYYDYINGFREESNKKYNRPDIGPSHGDELVNLFYMPEVTTESISDKEKQLSQAMVEYWTNYAIHGSPNAKNSTLPEWKPVQTNDIEYLYIGKDGIEMKSGLKKDRYSLWNDLGFKHDF